MKRTFTIKMIIIMAILLGGCAGGPGNSEIFDD